jgi:hypothetical protein
MFANAAPVAFSASIAAGGTNTFLAASAGVTYYMHTWDMSIGTTTDPVDIALQDTNGIVFSHRHLGWYGTPGAAYIPTPPVVDFKGAPVTTGRGIQLKNNGANAVTVYGSFTYSL